MAAKKDKGSIADLRADVQTLTDAFWRLRDAMLTDAAVSQAEQQQVRSAIANFGDLTDVPDAALTDAATLMATIGQPIRLRMVMLLAQQPVSVNSLVELLGLKTTGGAYHHLNVLMNHGVVTQPERGTFALANEVAPRIYQVLAALFGSLETDAPVEKSVKKKRKK